METLKLLFQIYSEFLFLSFTGGSQQELTGREKRVRRKKKENQDVINGELPKSRPKMRSSRERLAFDPSSVQSTADSTSLKKKKQARRRSDFGK